VRPPRQLIPDAPERARQEVADAEEVARAALHEVREAVAGYRQTSLAGEVAGSREVLAAAGIDLHYETAAIALPSDVEAVLAWAVREGVTNVVRHSRARHCAIRLARAGNDVRLEVVDDGHGEVAPPPSERTGSGIAGLAERARALGGTCEAGPLTGGGFCLAVTLPLATRSHDTAPVGAAALGETG
jgi:two-component system sensor histidine kinase DesK